MSETATPTPDSEMLADARREGADGLFTMVAAVDPDAVEIDRNYVGEKLARTCAGIDDGRPEAIGREMERSGDFIRALWDGDLAEALYRADARNKRLLIRLLDPDVLMAALIEDRGSYESAHDWFQPNRKRYGWEAADTFNDE